MMIRPNMALTYTQAKRISDKRGIWIVDYLRSRRLRDGMKAFFRHKHFNELKKPKD